MLYDFQGLQIPTSSTDEAPYWQALAQLLLPSTRKLVEGAGIVPGMKVLDAGCGTGDVSLLVAEYVGAEGMVVGIDHDPALLKVARSRTAGRKNVFFVEGDITSLDVDGSFDALIGRLILQHLSDPSALLRTLAHDILRPGGIIALQEADFTCLGRSVPAAPLFEQVGNWWREAMQYAGMDTQMGLRLYHVFAQAGLSVSQVECTSFVGGGPDWPWYDVIVEDVHRLLPILVAGGIATAEEVAVDTLVHRCRDELARLQGVVMAPSFFSAWTRTEM